MGGSEDVIVRESLRLLSSEAERQVMSRAASPFGDGYAARRIVDVLDAMTIARGSQAQIRAAV